MLRPGMHPGGLPLITLLKKRIGYNKAEFRTEIQESYPITVGIFETVLSNDPNPNVAQHGCTKTVVEDIFGGFV